VFFAFALSKLPSRDGGSQTSTAAPAATSDLGATVGIVDGHGFWACGSSEAALNQMLNLVALGYNAEAKRAMVRTHSIGLTPGLRVKILDVGFEKRKVRVLGLYTQDDENHNKMRLLTGDPRTGRECWVVSEALTGPKDPSP
jgi:hypothetical protein